MARCIHLPDGPPFTLPQVRDLPPTHSFSKQATSSEVYFLAGKAAERRAGRSFAPLCRSFREGAVAPIFSSLQMIMWPLVLSGIVGNVVNVIANCIFLYVFHLGIA